MNPLKYTFGITLGMFLGFVIWHCEIEINPEKDKVILEMPPPKSLSQIRFS